MPNKNKYVDFVSDSDFLECIKWVCDAYPEDVDEIDMKSLQKNTLDPFKMTFDMINNNISSDDWLKKEKIRQKDKSINNRIGDFHQKLFGKVKGWNDLGTGDSSKVDLKNDDETIFIELKNKENTVNSDSKDKVRDKLEKIIEGKKNVKAYWAYILSQKGDSGERIWKYHNKEDNNLRVIWGKNVYELITGDKDAMDKVLSAIPIAIKDYLKSKYNLKENDSKRIRDVFNASFQS